MDMIKIIRPIIEKAKDIFGRRKSFLFFDEILFGIIYHE